ncbi:MGH1-like glycoside hydrolase domain-containing protein [Phenylobacterium montanum]|uniref:MGH1-like glycoside hydrolase domain-containing protein n=1 Tax=Phenylobacterium montanum TaxID=2823693 RepID=UPI0035E3FFBF
MSAHSASAAASGPLDERAILADRFGADAPWYAGNIPLFEASDRTIEEVYYYRWKVFRAHQRDLGPDGYITTEFLDDVSWQRQPFASLNDATAFHIHEGRWLRDRRYVHDYIDFMYDGGGNDRHFSEPIAAAVYDNFLVDLDRPAALRHLDAMKHVYRLWDDHFDFDKGLYWIEPLADATEYTIASIDASGGKDGFTGGQAFRPSINGYMYANARAIARLSALAGDEKDAGMFDARADALRGRVVDSLWNDKLGHFVDRYKVDNAFVHYWGPIRGRELVGYLPWTFELAPDDATRAAAWAHLLSPAELGGKAGPRTVEPSYPNYLRQFRYDWQTGLRECQWNGPSWPFQTTQALTGLANLLHDYHQSVVGRADYLRLLHQYAALHFQDGRLDLEEDYDPDTGRPIVGLPRSHHYNHSGFADLIITGLAGLHPRADDVLEVDPLVPADPPGAAYFALQDAPYHGHLVTIVFDATGARYHRGPGLFLYADGRLLAHADRLSHLTAHLPSRPAAPIIRRLDLAMNLVGDDYPRPSASTNNDPASLHQSLDGRVWFFSDVANGWTTAGSTAVENWFAVDFGRPTAISAAELYFGGDARAFAAPGAYRIEVLRNGRWVEPRQVSYSPAVENGATNLQWVQTVASAIRVVMKSAPGRAVRLVEFKVF